MGSSSKKSSTNGVGRRSIIDKLKLGPQLIKYNRMYPGEHKKIAECLLKELNDEGITTEKITRHHVMRWLQFNEIPTESHEIIAQLAQELKADDRNFMVGKYDNLLKDAFEQYSLIKNNEELEPIAKLRSIDEVMKVLGRGLDAHGYGKTNVTAVQINQATVFLEERSKEFIQIAREECDGSTYERIIERLKLLAIGC